MATKKSEKITTKKMGRPRKTIDKDQFEKLCGLQCTEVEIASFFDCSVDTIEKFCKREYKETFTEVFNKKRNLGKMSLRRTQWKLAEKYPTMAIFLGKQYLDQKDKIEATVAEIDDDHRNEIEDFLNDEGTGTDIIED
jgi:hypothetical protein